MGILTLDHVFKKYERIEAVRDVSFEIHEGEIFGLLGPNGAGKSTLINMICGLLNITKGDILFNGKSVKKAYVKTKRQMGLVPQDIALYGNLSAYENVRFFCSLYGFSGRELDKRTVKALEYVGLLDRKKDKPTTFSGGMKRRLNIACAIAHTPKLIILDEPTVGIDPQSRNHILESIKSLNAEGSTIIYTSHYMEEVEAICSRVGIMDHGKLIALDTKENLKDSIGDRRTLIVTLEKMDAVPLDKLLDIQGVQTAHLEENGVRIHVDRDAHNFDQIVSYFVSQKLQVNNIENQTPNLEAVFMSLTGRTLRD
ncbi:ABC transporter ATP-binding protein [Vallitalea pronyensis]|uniref:ABC transporter ATP-binding protein n=1 Tax=Vallitalea pronyensis TaxID=1348613 RepID=A0A8J8MP56_9FIRM|nr:ABC transporter ATP-binding protein [Vallitalea pronyensis]QUI25532.1 ABC transporter ATP-binding protein [Vallitalea pronyensis]